MYWLALQVTKSLSIGSDMWTRLFARLGNRYFRRAYLQAPYSERLLFLPFCLRDRRCPTEVTPEDGLVCPDSCRLCRLGEFVRKARALGYRGAFIVPSSRILRGRGLLPSKEFIWSKIEQHRPTAALGAVCSSDFRRKYLGDSSLGRSGVKNSSRRATVVPQGLLLAGNSCIRNSLDWGKLERLLTDRRNAPSAGKKEGADG